MIKNNLFYSSSLLAFYLIVFALFSLPDSAHTESTLSEKHWFNVSNDSDGVKQSGITDKFHLKTYLLKNEDFYWSLLASINEADKEISASMYLFKTSSSHSGRANKLLEAFSRAVRRGVEVLFILDDSRKKRGSVSAMNKKTSERMIKNGITVRFDDLKRTTHTKVIVIDRKTVFLGSHNLTNSALQYNNEISVKIESAEVAEDVLAYLKKIK